MSETAAEWAEMVRVDQHEEPEGLSAARIDTDDYLYVMWRDEADSEGGRWAEMLRQGNAERALTYDKSLTWMGRYAHATTRATGLEVDYGCPVGFRQFLDVLDVPRMTAADL